MSTSTSSQQQLLGLNSSSRSLQDTEGSAVRPQPALLKLLHIAGAKGDTFTIKQVMHFLGQYIMVKQLFDKQQQHIVHCGTDELGKLLGITTFSVKDPSPLYEMLKKNLHRVSCTDAAQSPSRDQTQDTGVLERQKRRDNSDNEGSMDIGDRSSSSHTPFAEDDGNPAIQKTDVLDLSFEEWDCAGLPWWFLGNLRTNCNPLSNGSTDIPSNQDIDTALVSDTTDDLWFLSDSRSDQINVEVKVENLDSQDSEGEDVRGDEGKKVIELTIYEDDLEDTQSLSDTDTEMSSEDCWSCTNCHKLNSPSKRYCFRCWALRKDWYADCPPLTHTLSTPTLPAKFNSLDMKNGIDIPDCRRTLSAPMVRVRSNDNNSKVPFLEPLDLASNVRSLSESTDTLLSSEEASLESIRPLFEPCKLCQRRPRNGNVVHGRTAHLVTCFVCARKLKKTKKGCPVCQKPIQMVVKTYVA
ncbi:protein Mdm4 [Leptodactylus fuscus]|uniref:protein Mdm4 n=1 Tax=Leptodactylus fuscus TaxID=238119 RepID=UPI003F4EE21C